MDSRKVSVIIPSYNRAHLLWEVIPTYFQNEVLEVIVINDASTDNTQVVLELIKQEYPSLVIINNDENMKQTYSKNRGIDIARGEYVFFGDDDSVLLPGVISRLLNTLHDKKCDVVGARILYMSKYETQFSECINRHKIEGRFSSDLDTMEFSFTKELPEPVECFYAQALVLIPRIKLGQHRFDTTYTGNCYREETDFLFALFLDGFKFYYDSAALMINLPPQKATGGARTSNKIKYHYESVINNQRFLIKYNKKINELTGTNHTIMFRQLNFILKKVGSFIKKVV